MMIPFEVAYFDTAAGIYAVTPDCVGVYWYDTYDEVVDQHGPIPMRTIEYLED